MPDADDPDDDKPPRLSVGAAVGEERTALARLLPAASIVKGELKTQVTVTVTDITERAARAQLRVARAQYKEPVQVAMRYSVALPLLVILLLVFAGPVRGLTADLLVPAILAVAAIAGIVGWKFVSKLFEKKPGGEP